MALLVSQVLKRLELSPLNQVRHQLKVAISLTMNLNVYLTNFTASAN